MGRLIVHIADTVVLEGPIESTAVVRCEGDPLVQPLYQVRVAREVAAIQQGVVATGLKHIPRIGLIPSASGEERCGAEDFPEGGEVDVGETPALEEGIFLGHGEDLFVSLYS